jgi:uncharacterized protein (TIGR02246 family)
MKRLCLLPVFIGLMTLSAAGADRNEDDAAIQKRHDEWCAAWNQHDSKLLASFFLNDGDAMSPVGRYAKGTAEIEKLFTDEHTGIMAGTTYAGTIERIRYIGENVAIVDVAGEITGMKGRGRAPTPPFKHHVTWIAEKKDGKWMAAGARAFVSVPAPRQAQ